MHFEELWEKCENFHKQSDSSTSNLILDELMLKINLYQAISSRSDLPEEEGQKAKSRTLGEILLTLTHLSLHDNINVFDALNTALHYRSVDVYDKKYST